MQASRAHSSFITRWLMHTRPGAYDASECQALGVSTVPMSLAILHPGDQRDVTMRVSLTLAQAVLFTTLQPTCIEAGK